MKRKLWIISIGVVLLLVFSSLSTLQSQSIRMNAQNTLKNTLIPKEETENLDMIKIRVCHFQEDGSFEEISKELTSEENKEMMGKLMKTEISNSTPKEIFEEKLEILKEYDLVSSNITLKDIMDVEKLEKYNSLPFNVSEMEPFLAHFAPVFIGGFGFGAGFGFRGLPLIRRIAGNILSAGLIGWGAVLCFDCFQGVLYFQFTFTMPFLVHILAGFMGLMLFAFDSVFPPIPGKPPVTIYSNIVALGVAGLAAGFMIPSI